MWLTIGTVIVRNNGVRNNAIRAACSHSKVVLPAPNAKALAAPKRHLGSGKGLVLPDKEARQSRDLAPQSGAPLFVRV